MSRGQAALRRQWQLIELLGDKRYGMRIAEIIDQLGASRATVYRDLAVLRDAGVPIDTHNRNGEARVSLLAERDLPPLAPTALQIAALRLARRTLDGLSGTRFANELDTLLQTHGRGAGERSRVLVARQRPIAPDLVGDLDRAVLGQRRCRIRYRGTRDAAPAWRLLDPIALRWVKGHLYLVASEPQRPKPKTFKLDRISKVQLLREQARPPTDYDEHTLFARSIKTWTGDETDVTVSLSADVARFAREYPLIADQTLTEQPDGSLTVRARVAGIPEALRWVLSWGKEAEALEPPELRAAVAEELAGAASRYQERKPVGTRSRARQSSTRLTRSETGGG